jgi:hypothetical protein
MIASAEEEDVVWPVSEVTYFVKVDKSAWALVMRYEVGECGKRMHGQRGPHDYEEVSFFEQWDGVDERGG